MRIEYNHTKTYNETINNQIGTDKDFKEAFPDETPLRTIPTLTNADCLFVDPNNGNDNNIGTKLNPVEHLKMITYDLYNCEGTVDMSAGHDWSAGNQDFRIEYKYITYAGAGSEAWIVTKTVTLTANCTTLDEIITEINAKMSASYVSLGILLTAYKTDDNKIGIKNIPGVRYGSSLWECIGIEIIAGAVNDVCVTFGWTPAVYETPTNYNNAFIFTSTNPGTGNIELKEMFELNTGHEINVYVGQMDGAGVLSGDEYATMKFDSDYNGDLNKNWNAVYLTEAATHMIVSDITGSATDDAGLEKCMYILTEHNILRYNGKTVYYTNTDIADVHSIIQWNGKLYVSSNGDAANQGIWESSDGETWARVLSGFDVTYFFVWKNTLYANVTDATGYIYYTDDGTTWTKIAGTTDIGTLNNCNKSYAGAGNDSYCFLGGGISSIIIFDGAATESISLYSSVGFVYVAAVFELNDEIFFLLTFFNDYSKIYKVVDKTLSYVCDLPAIEFGAGVDYSTKYWFITKEVIDDIKYIYLGAQSKGQSTGGSNFNYNHYIFKFDGTTIITLSFDEVLDAEYPVYSYDYDILCACIYQGKMYFPYTALTRNQLYYRELSLINTQDADVNIQGLIFDGDDKAAYGIVPCRTDLTSIELTYNRYQYFDFAGIGYFCNNTVIGNSIFDDSGFGIYFNDDPDIDDCIFIGCTYGIYSDTADPDVEHCTFYECTTGAEFTAAAFTTVSFKNNLFHECSYDLVLDDDNEQDIDYCMFNGVTTNVNKGTNCINDRNPLFNDQDNYILTLWNKGAGKPIDSPAVNEADDSRDLGAWDISYAITGDTWDEYEFNDEIAVIKLGSEAVNSEELFTMNANLKTMHEGIRKIWSLEFNKGADTQDYYKAELMLNDTGVKRLYPAPKDGNTITGMIEKSAACTFNAVTGNLTATISTYNLKMNSLDSAFIRVDVGTGSPHVASYKYFVIEYNHDDGANHVITATNIFGYTGLSNGTYDVDIKHCCFWGSAQIDGTDSGKFNFTAFLPVFIKNQWRNFLFRVVSSGERYRIDSNGDNSISFTDVYEHGTTFTGSTDYSIMIESQLTRMKPENLDVETLTTLNGLQHGAELYVRTRTLDRLLQNWQGQKLTLYEVEDYE